MAERVLMKGNEALAEAAIQAGCRNFFGYPITPQTELAAYMAKRMPKIGGTYLQAESEVAAINMVLGAASTGVRVMTSSSSPGISLKTEGISYMAGSDVPALIINVQRGGPGLGGIQPSQADYWQATRAPGHGDLHVLVFAPSSVQEMVDLVGHAYDTADKYRMPAMILADGMLGQMMEPVTFGSYEGRKLPEKTWATNGTGLKRAHNVINSLYIDPDTLEKTVLDRDKMYQKIKETEVKYETENIEDADIIMVAYGTIGRIVKNAMKKAREEGIKVGLIRPVTLWPFPEKVINEAADKAKAFISVEMSTGQMVEDVKLAVNGKAKVDFYGRTGGVIPSPDEILAKIKEVAGGIE